MRTVIIGDPGALHVLTAKDLPDDLDLSFSYWRWVDFAGFDLSAYDLTDADIIECNGDGCILPDAINHLTSRRTSWVDAKIPATVGSAAHDLVAEVFRQGAVSKTEGQLVDAVGVYLTGDYSRSWVDAFPAVRKELGLETTGLGANVPNIMAHLAGYPRVAKRIAMTIAAGKFSEDAVAVETPLDKIDLTGAGKLLDLLPQKAWAQYDRWAFARLLEVYLRESEGNPEIQVYVAQLDPTPVVRVAVGKADIRADTRVMVDGVRE